MYESDISGPRCAEERAHSTEAAATVKEEKLTVRLAVVAKLVQRRRVR
jgi:hypothetical protein